MRDHLELARKMQYSNAFLDDQQFLTSSNGPFKGVFFISVYLLVLQQDSPSLTNGSRSNSSILLQGVYLLLFLILLLQFMSKKSNILLWFLLENKTMWCQYPKGDFSEKSDNKHLSKISHFSNLCLTLVGILLHILMTPIHQLQQATQPSALCSTTKKIIV